MRGEESKIQEILVTWFRVRYPDCVMCASSHAGLKMDARRASQAKRMGYLPGWPDIFIPHPMKGFHGLFIELKSMTGRVSPEQKNVHNFLSREGYACYVSHGFDEAVSVIDAYFDGGHK